MEIRGVMYLGGMVKRPDSLVNPRKGRVPTPGVWPADWPPRRRGDFRAGLAGWYRRMARRLPWRATRDPYAILVSEIMLQQTQVVTVVPYYERFLARFPTVESLAAADEADVLVMWAGLGYYRRARLLHAAARRVAQQYGGEFPRTAAELRHLPGIGPYTAAAVASFAFGASEALVDANVARVLARVFAWTKPLGTAESKRELWRMAQALLPPGSARQHNNALMELGAMVCTPQTPECVSCPVHSWCGAFAGAMAERLPVPSSRPAVTQVCYAGAIVRCGIRYLVRQVPPGEWHSGMWEFPKMAIDNWDRNECPWSVQEMLAGSGAVISPVPPANIRYTVTHHRIVLWLWSATARRIGAVPRDHKWATLEEIRALPLGAPQKRIVKMLAGDSLFAVEP